MSSRAVLRPSHRPSHPSPPRAPPRVTPALRLWRSCLYWVGASKFDPLPPTTLLSCGAYILHVPWAGVLWLLGLLLQTLPALGLQIPPAPGLHKPPSLLPSPISKAVRLAIQAHTPALFFCCFAWWKPGGGRSGGCYVTEKGNVRRRPCKGRGSA